MVRIDFCNCQYSPVGYLQKFFQCAHEFLKSQANIPSTIFCKLKVNEVEYICIKVDENMIKFGCPGFQDSSSCSDWICGNFIYLYLMYLMPPDYFLFERFHVTVS